MQLHTVELMVVADEGGACGPGALCLSGLQHKSHLLKRKNVVFFLFPISSTLLPSTDLCLRFPFDELVFFLKRSR